MRSASFRKILAALALGAFTSVLQAQFTFDHIGTGATGSLTTNDLPTGNYTLIGGGDDIWDASDNFDFAHYTQAGDFDVRVRVESLEPVARWSKAGLMVREDLTPISRMLFNRVTPPDVATGNGGNGANDTRLAFRTGPGSSGGANELGSGNPGYPDAWLRLARSGASFGAFRSSDGSNWVSQNTQNTASWPGGALANSIQFGLAVARHSGADTLATAEFRDYSPSPLSIAAQPANTLVSTGQTATFTVGVASGFASYVTYQWRENGTDISGANSASYSKANALSGDNGNLYSVFISNRLNGLTVTSGDATLGTTNSPQVASAANRGNPVAVYVVFNQNMEVASAEATANYSIPGLTISAASLGADQRTVTLTTSAQVEDTAYVLTVSAVKNSDGNVLTPDPTVINLVPLSGGVTKNSIVMKRFYGFGGGLVSDLTSNPNFPNNPGDTSFRPLLEIPPDVADDYGAQMYGIFVAPVTGNYNFYISSDDEGKLYLSSDADPANKAQIATEPQWAGQREFIYPSGDCCGRPGNYRTNSSPGVPVNIASNISLVAGERRYLEMLMKEGGGGDNAAVAVEYPGSTAVANGSSPIPSALFETINRVKNGFTFTNYGPVLIVQDPTNKTVFENNPASFSVVVDGTPGYAIQWYSNGVAIPGANALTYTFNAPSSASGSQYHVIVANDFSSATSAVATLTVLQAPQLLSVSSRGNPTGVYLTFSKPMDASALNTANYTVTNAGGSVAISSAAYFDSNSNVIALTVAPLTLQATYTGTVGNVQDENGNTIFPNPSSAVFTHGAGINAPAGLTLRRYDGSGDYNTILNKIATCQAPQRNNPNLPSFEYGTNPSFNNSDPDTENYGAWMYGVFVAPTTGNYEFRMNADDFAQLFLSTDASPANKQVIVQQSSWGAGRDFVLPSAGNNVPPPSPLIPLVAGRSYYMELIYQEGGGGDHGAVAVRLPGGPAIVDGTANVMQRSMFSTNYSFGCPPTAFFQTLGPVTTTGPADQTVNEGANASFTVAMDGTPPYGIQWYSNGVAVTGANGANYTFRALRFADGAQFWAVVTNGFSSTTSSVATLTVITDTAGPVALRAYGSGVFTNVTIEFNEPIDIPTGTETSNYTITNSAGASLAIYSISIRDNTNVVLLTDPQTSGERYTVVLNNVSDRAGVPNPIVANSAISFSGWVLSQGFALMETYNTGGGNLVSMLTGHPTYPNYPRERYYIARPDSRQAYPDDSHEAYGGRISGLYSPAADGTIQFSINNDDDAALRGSFTENPADAQDLGSQGCCSGAFRNTGPAIPLVAANRYYYELLWKEGVGGDYAALSDNGTAPVANAQLSIYANPDAVSLVITQQPLSQTRAVNQQPTFSVGTSLSIFDGAVRPLLYQWTSNGVDIAGATASSYTTPPLTLDNNGDIYSVRVRTPGASLVSSNAVLEVILDETGPVLVSAVAGASFRTITLTWSEPVDPGAANEPGNYQIYDPSSNALTVIAVTHNSSNVVLQLDTAMLENANYYLEAGFQADMVGNPTVKVGDPLIDTANGVVATVRSFVVACGFTYFEAFLGLTVPDYQNPQPVIDAINNRVPPSFWFYTNQVNWPQSSPDINNYGMHFYGLFRAPATGTYKFEPSHDDSGNLLFSPDANPANATVVMDFDCCSGFGAGEPGYTVNLVEGQSYYFDLRVVEAGGGDYAGLAVTLPNGQYLAPIPAAYLGVAVDPSVGDSINVGIAQQPQDQTISENNIATFSVVVTNPGPWGVAYQWQLDSGSGFADLAGATSSSYTTPVRQLGDSGDLYRVKVCVPGKTLMSSVATLTVNPDTNAPTVVSATVNCVRFVVQFSEPVGVSGGDPANYSLNNGASVSAASVNGSTVVLTTSALNPAGNYVLTVSGVTDLAGNLISPNPTATFVGFSTGFSPNGSGQIVFEGEDYDGRAPSSANHNWTFNTSTRGAAGTFSGTGDMAADPNNGGFWGNDDMNAGRLDYCVNFPVAGTWFVWVRYVGPTGGDNSLHLGVDGAQQSHAVGNNASANRYEWNRFRNDAGNIAQVPVASPGIRRFSIWMREDGTRVDKVLLTQDSTFTFADITELGPVAGSRGLRLSGTELTIVRSGGITTITWPGSGTLQSATSVLGPWTDVVGATSPYTVDTTAEQQQFFRVRN